MDWATGKIGHDSRQRAVWVFFSVLHRVHTVSKIAQELGSGLKWLGSEAFNTEIKNAWSSTSITVCLNGGVLN